MFNQNNKLKAVKQNNNLSKQIILLGYFSKKLG